MDFQAEILLTRFFPFFAVFQAYFFLKTIWNKSNNQGAIHLFMAMIILLILVTNTYALYQLEQASFNGQTHLKNPLQMTANLYMTFLTSIGFLILIFISKERNVIHIEKGIALVIFIFTLINVGFSIQSLRNFIM
jgi:hypothetical protein